MQELSQQANRAIFNLICIGVGAAGAPAVASNLQSYIQDMQAEVNAYVAQGDLASAQGMLQEVGYAQALLAAVQHTIKEIL